MTQLAEEHPQIQEKKRSEEDIADQYIKSFNSSIVWYTIVEVMTMLATIVIELMCLRDFLRRHKVI
jgi:hypothetical protein